MIISKGISFTEDPPLFEALQNRGKELLLSVSRRLMRSYRFPFALLITCDRAEVIAQADGPIEVLERALGLNPAKVREYRYSYEGEEALLRLFMLSAGVLSPLFGEDTIQGQLNDSLEAGLSIGTLSPSLAKLLNMAVSFSKRIHTEMKVRVFDQTIADAVAARLGGKGDVLVIGSGEGARIVAERLIPEHKVRMTLRDTGKTFLIPPGAEAVAYDERLSYIPLSDGIVSVTSGLYHTLSADDGPILEGRMLFDLSSPPDTPPALHAITVESLAVELPLRDGVMERVRREAMNEVGEYKAWLLRSASSEGIALKAESIAYETLRRMSSVITRAGMADEEAFRRSLFDSVRKAVISTEMDARRY